MVNAAASNQKTGVFVATIAWAAFLLALGACGAPWRSARPQPIEIRGMATTAIVIPKIATVARQPMAFDNRAALGKDTVPANPATRVTRVMARRACAPIERIRTTKHAS
jgi:hypothetical protein